jgi:hypothetical protein
MNRALLVGVNAYDTQTHLAGCINDVEDVRKALVDRGTVDASNVVVLTDHGATKNAILTLLAQLVDGLAEGDCGYFHFSGHGVRMASSDPEEPDGRDEVLCPYEFDWTADTAIVDNEILAILGGLQLGARLVVTIDSCHSGDFARFAPIPNAKPRTLRPPKGTSSTRGPTRLGFRAAGRAPNVTFVSACSPWQTAADAAFGGRPNGAFTYYFLQHLASAPADMTLTDDVVALEPPLQDYEMTPVAENGGVPYFSAPRTTNGKRTPAHVVPAPLARATAETRAGVVVFDQAWHAGLLGQDVRVGVRIVAMNGQLTSFATVGLLGHTLASPPIPTAGNLTYPMSLGFFGLRMILTVSEWSYSPLAIRFVLEVDLGSSLGFVPRVRVARVPVQINLATLPRDLGTASIRSPSDLLALLTLQQMHDRTGDVAHVEAAPAAPSKGNGAPKPEAHRPIHDGG